MPHEKYALETGALNQFGEALAPIIGDGRFIFDRLLEPPNPDALCSFDGQPLHVEVTHIYGTKSDTKILLGRTGRSAPNSVQRALSARTPLTGYSKKNGKFLKLLTPLNDALSDKATKKYQSLRVWLLIRSGSPLWSKEDFIKHQASIVVPKKHPFQKIWLLCGPRASYGLLQLM